MSRWWRAYDEAVDDPKLQRLGPKLGWAWFNLMCIASKNDGNLPAIGDIAFKLRITEQQAAATLTALVSAKLFDRQEDGHFIPHNWNARQYRGDVTDPTNATRQKRYRDKLRNGVTAVTVPLRSNDQIQTTETEKKDAADAAPDPEKELFRRGREVLGKQAGGLISKLLAAKQKNIALARAAIEQASTKDNPREYVGRIINGQKPGETSWLGGIEGII